MFINSWSTLNTLRLCILFCSIVYVIFLYKKPNFSFVNLSQNRLKCVESPSFKPFHSVINKKSMLPGGQSPQRNDPTVLIHWTIGTVEQPPLLVAHSSMSRQVYPFPCQPKKQHRKDIRKKMPGLFGFFFDQIFSLSTTELHFISTRIDLSLS